VDADADNVAGLDLRRSNGSSDSSTMSGVPNLSGVAAASTYNQRGVTTPIRRKGRSD
jgi:hypothetical protein